MLLVIHSDHNFAHVTTVELSCHKLIRSWFFKPLTHWALVTYICICKLISIASDNGLSPGRSPRHYLKQCWNVVNWTLGNKLQWNLNRNLYIFIQENAFENRVSMCLRYSNPFSHDIELYTHKVFAKMPSPLSFKVFFIWYHIPSQQIDFDYWYF